MKQLARGLAVPLTLLLIIGLLLASLGRTAEAAPTTPAALHNVFLPLALGPDKPEYELVDVFWGSGQPPMIEKDSLFIIQYGLSLNDPSGIAPFKTATQFPVDPGGNAVPVIITSDPQGAPHVVFKRHVEGAPLPEPYRPSGVGNPGNIPPGAFLGTIVVGTVAAGALIGGAPFALIFIGAVGIGLVAAYVIHEFAESQMSAELLAGSIPADQPELARAKSLAHARARDALLQSAINDGKSISATMTDDVAFGDPGQNPCNMLSRYNNEWRDDLFELRVLPGHQDWKQELVRVEVWERSTNKRVAYAYTDLIEGTEGGTTVRYLDPYVNVDRMTPGGIALSRDQWGTMLLSIVNDLGVRLVGDPDIPVFFTNINNGYQYNCYKSMIRAIIEQLSPDEILHLHREFWGSPQAPRNLPNYYDMLVVPTSALQLTLFPAAEITSIK